MADNLPIAPPGWHYDEDTGALIRDVIHRMGRRCHNWDYCGKGVYQITIVQSPIAQLPDSGGYVTRRREGLGSS